MFTPHRRTIHPWLKAVLTFIAACAVLANMPVAYAEPDPSPSPSPSPDPEDQQQNQGPGMPKLPKLPKNNGAPKGDLADKNCWVIDGVPTWNAPGTAPRAIGPGETAVPCYYVYGLQPH